jgi:hypothetical protein
MGFVTELPLTAACNIGLRVSMCLKKARYPSKAQALVCLKNRMESENPPEFLRVYRCMNCKGWHLTKQKR